MRNAFLKSLYDIARNDKNVLSLIADNGMIVYDEFKRDMPEQYFNFGISENHMVAAAAGMASCGKIPYIYTIGAFLAYRCYEFIRLDVCLQNLNVKIIGIGAGISYGYLGPTHHATEDIACLRVLPNLQIFSPATAYEAKKIIEYSYKQEGPMYIRLGNNLGKELYEGSQNIEIGKGSILRKGKNDVAIFVVGEIIYQVIEAYEQLKLNGIEACVISMHSIKPFDAEIVKKYAAKCDFVFTVEEHMIVGGLGSAVAEVIAENGISVHFQRIGLCDHFAKGYGTNQEVRAENDLDALGIYNAIKIKLFNERI